MILFRIAAWFLVLAYAVLELLWFRLSIIESGFRDGVFGFVVMTILTTLVAYVLGLVLAFVAGLFGVLCQKYGEKEVIGGAITLLLLGSLWGR